MRFNTFVYLISLFSLFIIGPSSIPKYNDYYKIESHFKEKSQFIENGVKLQYTTNNQIENEIKRIEKNIKKRYKNIKIEENKIQVMIMQGTYEIMLWEENDSVFVEATLINQNDSYGTQEIKKELEKLQEEHLKNIRYFEYYKGKIKSIEEGVDGLEACSNIKEYKMLKIENGLTCSAISKNNTKVNIAFNEYNTGIYVVIGTPTIFATY
ncbi:MAG: hypothetical protein ACRC7N_18475 [Clostridium sp.]